ncbi:MAG: hypothetical protein LBP59_16510 [Planctomycetaceae bacterium]|jgi:endonuclease-3 related protein|nr:hypothetical protein [Planctomycetaceae bacterium]
MSVIRKIYETLLEYYEIQPFLRDWLSDPVELIIGAVIVQGTTWRVGIKVLNLLRERSLLGFRSILSADDALLSDLIRPVGFYLKKAKRLKEISRLFLDFGDGNVNTFFARDVDRVRQDLLRVQGISPGTVDNIILYAGKLPIYVVDLYTARVFFRHEIVPAEASNADIQQIIHFELVPDEEPYGAKLFSEFQTCMVKIGQTYCDVQNPNCGQCPLAVLLPPTGARNINIPEEPTIQTTPVIIANKLKLKQNRPKLYELTPEQLPKIISVTKKQTKQITQSQIKQPQITNQKNNKNYSKNTQNTNSPIQQTAPIQQQQQQQPIITLQLNDMERQIVECIGNEPVQIDLIVQSTKLPVHLVRATIAILEMKKILRQVEGNKVDINEELKKHN